MKDEAALKDHTRFGYDFITAPYLGEGTDEYHLRNKQAGVDNSSYRGLRPDEIEALERNLNTSTNWDDVLVSDIFDPSLVRNTEFYGLVRLGAISRKIVSFHDFAVPVGIVNSRIISCDIGSGCAIYDCTYLSHYIICDHVILYRIGEMQATNHAKFGSGILKEGESEEVRIAIDIMNEASGRAIRPFDGMLTSDAYLWGTWREDGELMRAFERFTEDTMDRRRGYYGYVGQESVIKSCGTIKDVWVGEGAYIKGANKLKNLTLRSTKSEPVQIGEGVELVNGIIGSGSRIFYGVKAIRFIIGDNSNLKYGARLIHSFLGDNCTVSCCELLNSLIFNGHEQHHNNSFLVAALLMGQSNMAAGANIGSNHNSRANDGELIAGRGFWPALSSSLKYDCKFASYVLLDKGNFPHELNIPIPFSLVTTDEREGRRLLMPAYWWMYNLYALERNSYKYRTRDKRKTVRQHIEVDYLAPDTANEILAARHLLEQWVGSSYQSESESPGTLGKTLLRDHPELVGDLEVLAPGLENSTVPMRVLKAGQAYAAYDQMLRYWATWAIADYAVKSGKRVSLLQDEGEHPLKSWLNVGGQLVMEERVEALLASIKEGSVSSWDEVHQTYELWHERYEEDRAHHALAILYALLEVPYIDENLWQELTVQCGAIRVQIEEQVFKTKAKDYHNHFREITFRSRAEQEAVLGRLDENPFIAHSKVVTEALLATLSQVRYS